MSTPETIASTQKEKFQAKETVGIVLVNNFSEFNGWFMPDLEGRERFHPALDDLITGRIDRLIVTGGWLKKAPKPMGKLYADYARDLLQRFVENGAQIAPKIEQYSNGGETISDIEGIVGLINKNTQKLILYTSKWQMTRSYEILRWALLKNVWDVLPLVVEGEAQFDSTKNRVREGILEAVVWIAGKRGRKAIRTVALKQRTPPRRKNLTNRHYRI